MHIYQILKNSHKKTYLFPNKASLSFPKDQDALNRTFIDKSSTHFTMISDTSLKNEKSYKISNSNCYIRLKAM